MHEYILNAIKISQGFATEESFCNYLRSLQEQVKSVRSAYNRSPVRVDYSNKEIQNAYMITYFPHYAAILTEILMRKKDEINTYKFDKQSLWILGGGPCPELLGYLNFLNEIVPEKSIEINLLILDINLHSWEYSRNLNLENIALNYIGNNKIMPFIALRELDICTKLIPSMTDVPKFIIIQNCLNECSKDNHGIIIENIVRIFKSLPNDSTLIITDLNMPRVEIIIEKIENAVRNLKGFRLIKSVTKGKSYLSSPFAIYPQIVTENLLTGRGWLFRNGLIPKRDLHFFYSMIYKD